MGFRGECSDDGGDLEELVSLCGSETEEDEDGNQLPKRFMKEVKLFQDSEILKEAAREFSLKQQLGLWFGKNCREKN
ncbi:hypothetical protein M0R45_036427 [Rubus argutus]|uniref:Uncharacterized protein n=1 Tax=Rubus argutus TaxID=59490 RepID=A0AAW1VZM0_RUBAR